MARKPDDVQVQVVMSEAMRRELGKAALVHQDDVERDRLMNRGPMLAYVARWFLEQPESEQLRIILEGKGLMEGKPAPPREPARIVAVRGPFPASRDDPYGKPTDVDPPKGPSGVARGVKRKG